MEAVGVPGESRGGPPMDALEVSASSLLANVPLTKERHKTKLRFQELKKETAFLDRKGGRDTLQKTMHIKRCEHI